MKLDLAPTHTPANIRPLWQVTRAGMIVAAGGAGYDEDDATDWPGDLGRALAFADACYIDREADTITFAFGTEDDA